MRAPILSTLALAAGALQGVNAQAEPTTSTVSTFTTTRTVLRVVTTVTATRPSGYVTATGGSSLAPLPITNGTSSVFSTGSMPLPTTSVALQPSGSSGAAGVVMSHVEALGVLAVAGMVGLWVV